MCLPSSSRCDSRKVVPYTKPTSDDEESLLTLLPIFTSLRRKKTLSSGCRTKMTHLHICRRRQHRQNGFLFFWFPSGSHPTKMPNDFHQPHILRHINENSNGYSLSLSLFFVYPTLSVSSFLRSQVWASVGQHYRHLYTFAPVKCP